MTSCTPGPAPGESILLRELHHRIGNEIATAVHLVSTAAVRAETAETKAALSDVTDILQGQAELHRILAMPDGDALIDAAAYIRKIGAALRRCMLDRMNIDLAFATESIPLQSERCWQLGLIVHDLISHAARSACFDGRPAVIKVRLSRTGAVVNCVVLDNGSRSSRGPSGRELRISSDLAKRLSGRVEQGIGAEFTSVVLSLRMTERERRASWTMALRRMRTSRRLRAGISTATGGDAESELPAAARLNPDLPQCDVPASFA